MGSVLGSLLDHVQIILGSLFGSVWDHVGMTSLWGHCVINSSVVSIESMKFIFMRSETTRFIFMFICMRREEQVQSGRCQFMWHSCGSPALRSVSGSGCPISVPSYGCPVSVPSSAETTSMTFVLMRITVPCLAKLGPLSCLLSVCFRSPG